VIAPWSSGTSSEDTRGAPEQRERREAQFCKSLDVIPLRLEKEGIQLRLEPQPNDFVESGIEAVNMIRAINSPNVVFLYCVSDCFHQGGSMREVMEYAGKDLSPLHISDTFNHHASHGNRYILNPPGTPARVHQHLEIGDGEVDFDEFFQALADVKFDGIATVAVFSRDQKIVDSSQRIAAILKERLPSSS
jgi:myo-inositol catabolism protein IolH